MQTRSRTAFAASAKGANKNSKNSDENKIKVQIAICTACDLPDGTPFVLRGCERNQRRLGEIAIDKKDSFATLLKKINVFLVANKMPKVESFHYLQEDGDLNYASARAFSHDDLVESLQWNKTFFVYFDDTC